LADANLHALGWIAVAVDPSGETSSTAFSCPSSKGDSSNSKWIPLKFPLFKGGQLWETAPRSSAIQKAQSPAEKKASPRLPKIHTRICNWNSGIWTVLSAFRTPSGVAVTGDADPDAPMGLDTAERSGDKQLLMYLD